MARLVRFRVIEGVAVVTLEAPPVNALSQRVRAGLWEAFARIGQNADIKAAVLMATGKMFSAGADIREFGKTLAPPTLSQLCDHIETCSKPVIAALHGQALGGGAELALAAHYRLASPDARIGLPEVALGLVPGAGGTQRLPRLIGADLALQMMISTNSVDTGTGQRIGLVDGVVQGDLGSGAIAYAQNLLKQDKGVRRTRDNRLHFSDGRAHWQALSKAREALRASPLHAPERVVECVEAAALLPFEAGQAFEADAFERCLDHPQSIALRHIFVAERQIDAELIEREGASFNPVAPMGKAAVIRLRNAMRAAGDLLVEQGVDEARIDGAMVAYGFRRGPFGNRDEGAEDDRLVRQMVAALLVEGAQMVEQQAVQRPSDIDVLAVHGLGFPRRHGGPMRAAQSMGLIGLRRDMRHWGEMGDNWAVPALLDEAIKDARGFDSVGRT